MAERKQIDWEAIEREYRAGTFSIAEIARQHEITHPAILRKAKRLGWKRDLTVKVRKRIAEKLVTDITVTGTDDKAKEEEIIEAAADRGAAVIKCHREDIAKLQAEEQSLLKELGNNPTRLWIAQYQGNIIQKEVGIAVTDRAGALQALAAVQHKRIALERQAYNIDEDGRRPDAIDEIAIMVVSPEVK